MRPFLQPVISSLFYINYKEVQQINKNKNKEEYTSPYVQAFGLSVPLSILIQLSVEGDVNGEWQDGGELGVDEY